MPLTSLDAVSFPSAKQRDAAERIYEEITSDGRTLGFALTCSLAQGYGDARSDLDVAVYARREHHEALRAKLQAIHDRHDGEGLWVDYDVTDGRFEPGPMGWCDVDAFEKEVGNVVVHTLPLFERQGYVSEVRAPWLPYYDEELAVTRERRWAELTLNHGVQARRACDRGEGLEAVERLYQGVQTFVAGLFCARRVYPIDYLKRVDRHLRVLLGIQGLGAELNSLFDVGPLETPRLRQSFARLDGLAREWLPAARKA
jgi:hypothetical protein